MLKQVADSWVKERAKNPVLLLKMGFFATLVYEAVISVSPMLPCLLVVSVNAALLAQEKSWRARKQIEDGELRVARALLALNLFTLVLYFCSLSDLFLRCTATFHVLILGTIASQLTLSLSVNDILRLLLAGLVVPLLKQQP